MGAGRLSDARQRHASSVAYWRVSVGDHDTVKAREMAAACVVFEAIKELMSLRRDHDRE